MKDHIANYEKILMEKKIYGKSLPQIAHENGLSYTYVFSAWTMFNAVADEEWDKVANLLRGANMPYERVEWAAGKLGKKLPPFLKETYEERLEMQREKNRKKYAAKKEPQPDLVEWIAERKEEPKPAPAPAEIPPEVIVEKTLDNTALCMRKILENQAKIIELMEQLMDVVIPKWAVHATDNANANGDSIQEMLKPIAASLDAIRCNTKKRGL